MIKYTQEFLSLLQEVEEMKLKLKKKEKELQKECPHVLQNSESAFPRSISHSECSLCGMSDYYLGREEML